MSRKKQVNQKITALYCRISLDDGGDNESMSISNQKLMLKEFAEKNGMFQYEYYVDDGYTGRNFNRPAFQRMIADIEAGKIGCVITKDLSRLGRNYIEAGSYIEIFFPKHNVRYIAITDGVDSLTRQEMDITPFKNILNDMYRKSEECRMYMNDGNRPAFGVAFLPEPSPAFAVSSARYFQCHSHNPENIAPYSDTSSSHMRLPRVQMLESFLAHPLLHSQKSPLYKHQDKAPAG